MKSWVMIGAALALAGCETVQDLDKGEPKLNYQSQKSAPQLEECISLALSSAGTPNVIRGENRRILDYNSDGLTMWTITISETAPTSLDMRWSGGLAAKWRNRVLACK